MGSDLFYMQEQFDRENKNIYAKNAQIMRLALQQIADGYHKPRIIATRALKRLKPIKEIE